jgi:hypothetical protein
MGFTRVDVHAHFLPAFYNDALVEAGQTHPDGMPAIPKWSEEAALTMMDKLQIKAAVLSIFPPGVHFGDDLKAKQLARRVNEEGTRLRQAHPGRFGLFAATPLPDAAAQCRYGDRRGRLCARRTLCGKCGRRIEPPWPLPWAVRCTGSHCARNFPSEANRSRWLSGG